MNTLTRIAEIDAELAELEKEKAGLEIQLKTLKEERWSEAGVKDKLRKVILSHYGSVHNIKLAILRMGGVYDDSYYDYENPSLVLIDNDFNEIKHSIRAKDLCPSHDEQRECMHRRVDICEEVTLKFA